MSTYYYLDWFAKFPPSSSFPALAASGSSSNEHDDSLFFPSSSKRISDHVISRVVFDLSIKAKEQRELTVQSSGQTTDFVPVPCGSEPPAAGFDNAVVCKGCRFFPPPSCDTHSRIAHLLSQMRILTPVDAFILCTRIAALGKNLAKEAARRGNHHFDLEVSIEVLKTEMVEICCHGDPCAICLEEFSDHEGMKLPCSHAFHNGCILKWLGKGQRTCPLCRFQLWTGLIS